MNNSKQVLALSKLLYRQMSSAPAAEKVAPRFCQLKGIQKKFQIDDGVPVYIKSGFGDTILYKATFALSLIGVGLSLQTFYTLVFKK